MDWADTKSKDDATVIRSPQKSSPNQQGVYPIKSEVLVDGKTAKPVNNKMQLVLNVDRFHQYQIIALHQ